MLHLILASSFNSNNFFPWVHKASGPSLPFPIWVDVSILGYQAATMKFVYGEGLHSKIF
jgi:hypothetical protein